MRHQCSTCFREFFDDAPSSSPPERVFCVFCGTQLLEPSSGSRAMPFSPDCPRDESFALGVIGGAGAGFPDTLRQFRVASSPRGLDSLAPVHHESEPPQGELVRSRRLGRLWTSLAVGFAIGASAAVLFAERGSPRAAVAPTPTPSARRAAPPLAVPACPPPSPPPTEAATSAAVAKPPVTPQLEKRFWLERARSAQHQFRLADAERFYRRALVQAPQDSEVLAGLGEVELLRGARAAAQARFREALEASSDYVPARVALADLHWESGRAEDARREYQDIIEHYPAESFPPYVSQRLEGGACVPECAETPPTTRTSSVTNAP